MSYGVGAFIVTFAVLSYFLGTSNSNQEFLVNVAISAVVALLAGRWLGRDRKGAALEAGEFDERATRRAVRRGVVRTALVAVVWVFLGAIVLGIASSAWQTRGNRSSHFGLVAGHGFQVGHPGYRNYQWYCCNTGIRSLELSITGTPMTASPVPVTPLDLKLHLNLRDHLTTTRALDHLAKTGVDAALDATLLTKAQLRPRLAGLPDGLVATAIVELRAPTTISEFYRLLARHGIVWPDSADVPVFLQSADYPYPLAPNQRPVPSQDPSAGRQPSVAAFQTWVKSLHTSDNPTLGALHVPSLATLQQVAARPRIHAFVLDQASTSQLRTFLADPAVRTIKIGDTAYNLDPSSQP